MAASAAAQSAPTQLALDACLNALRRPALSDGITIATFDRYTQGLEPDESVLESLDYQPEFVTPVWDYLAALVDDERVADGRARLAEWRDTLSAVESRFGVDPETVVAVWGVESDYGRTYGRKPVVRSLATLSCFGRRQSFFRGEFVSTLRILQEGHVSADRLTGSWAGAFGQTQFMPSTFVRAAVDFDHDGRRDIIGSVPDALASTANFLKQAGWHPGEPWGFEVSLPGGFDAASSGRRNKQPLSVWATRGVRRVDGAGLVRQTGDDPRLAGGNGNAAAEGAAAVAAAASQSLPGATPAGLLLPAGESGPAFLVLRNFDAIFSYNAAESYALAIAHLADRLRGGGPFVRPWPTDDPGLGRAERRALQTLLLERGHAIGEVDGLVGPKTREAIRAEEVRLGWEPSGRAGRKILEALRTTR